MTWQEKREARFRKWLNPSDVKFSSPEAEKQYKIRATRMIKAVKMEIPDRVPCMIPTGWFPAMNAGITLKEAMYDAAMMKWAWLKFVDEFDSDTFDGTLFFQAPVSNLLESKTMKWPGHGLHDKAHSYQYVEGEYMKADEYDLFMKDPLDFQLRYLLPRTMGILEPLADAPSFSSYQGLPQRLMGMCLDPRFQKLFQAINEAAQYLPVLQKANHETTQEAAARGFPMFRGGMAVAPFDVFADSLRGTHGIVMDMYRQPDKIQEAMEFVLPQLLSGAVMMSDMADCPVVMMPLHKGDDTFMSDAQFETFYWPTFRRLLISMVEEGLVPMPFAEGIYTSRLKQIADTPKSSVVWYFDQTNMAEAKRILGDVCCIVGNVPTAVVMTSPVELVKENCRQLIETCAPGGGYILAGGASINTGNIENLKAMMESAYKYGVY